MQTEIIHSSLENVPVRILVDHDPYSMPARELGTSYCPVHIHDELEIIEATIGNVGVRVNNREYILKPYESMIIKSRIPHQTFAACEYSSHRGLQLDPDILSETSTSRAERYLSRFINSGEMHIFRANEPAASEIHNCLELIMNEYNEKRPAYETYIRANLYLLLGCCYRHGILNNADLFFDRREVGKIMPLLTYLDTNYAEQITLQQAGAILNLNADYFCRLFKKATNTTFTDYLNFVRVCHTEKPLTFSDKTIAEISLDAGFSSVSYFNRVFKKYKLVTPSEYRKSQYSHE